MIARISVAVLISALVLGGLFLILRYTGPGTNGPLTGANENGSGRG